MKKRYWLLLLLLVLAGAAGFHRARSGAWFWAAGGAKAAGKTEGAGAAGGRGGRGGFGGPVPVVVAEARLQDVPIYLDGLGTVQAFNSVTIRPRVEGQLEKVAFSEGQDVKEGDLLAVIDERPYRSQVSQAEAKKRQDEAQLANAQAIAVRNTELLKKGVLDRQTFDTSRFQSEQLQATVQADQAALENARIQLGYTRITSPIDGRAGLRQIDEGSLVQANDPRGLVIITQLRPISVVFTLPEQSLPAVLEQQGGSDGALKVSVLDRANTRVIEQGTLTVIDNQIDQTTGTVKLKATFANDKLSLWPGQFVNARLLLSIQKNGVVVPASAVQRGPNGTYAYVVDAEQKVGMRPVRVRQSEGDLALIAEGLSAGDKVVIDGQYKLQPGAQVIVSAPRVEGNAPSLPGTRRGGNGRAPGSKHEK